MTLADSQPDAWDSMRQLLSYRDEQIDACRRRLGIERVRPRFTAAVLLLHEHGPLPIRALAQSAGVSHSAMSQTVAAMRVAGLVESRPGPDARVRMISLSPDATEMVPLLRAEVAATRRVIDDLESISTPSITDATRAVQRALAVRSFADRLEDEIRHGERPRAP